MIAKATFLKDSLIFIRNKLRANITDPLSRTGSGNQFIFTSYPRKDIKYPIITVKENGMSTIRRLGMQSELVEMSFPVEIRVWARNEVEKDELSENVFVYLKDNQYGSGSSVDEDMFGFNLVSSVNVDEPGEEGIKSRITVYEYKIYI